MSRNAVFLSIPIAPRKGGAGKRANPPPQKTTCTRRPKSGRGRENKPTAALEGGGENRTPTPKTRAGQTETPLMRDIPL